MASAKALVNELIGNSDDESYEDDDYYDEECDDYYSPFAAPPPVKPEIIEVEQKVESPEPVPIIEKFFCDVCNAHFPKTLEQGHETSKKHKGALVDLKIKQAQERSVVILRQDIAKKRKLFEDTFSEKIFVKVLSYLDTVSLPALRLVADLFNKYLQTPHIVNQLCYIHTGKFFDQVNYKEFALLGLRHRFVIFDQISLLKNFLERVNAVELPGRIQLKINLSYEFHPKGTEIPEEVLHFLATVPAAKFSIHFSIFYDRNYPLYADFFSAILERIAQNPNIKSFSSNLKGEQGLVATNSAINPFKILMNTTSIESISLGATWLRFLDLAPVDSKSDELLSWFFNPKSVKRLKVHSEQNSSARHAKYLLSSLEGNQYLETLELLGLALNAHCTSQLQRLKDLTTLKTLRLCKNLLLHANVVDIQLPPHLETLDLSENPLGQGNYRWTGHPLKSLIVRKCAFTTFIGGIPQSIESLDISSNQNIDLSLWLRKLGDYKSLTALKVSNMVYNSIGVFSEFLKENRTVKHLELFKETTVRSNDHVKIIDYLRQNSTLIYLDHHSATLFLTLPVCDHIQELLDANARLNSGRLTKGRR